MLRVCGVTFDHKVNYGSAFQAYALQTVIEQMNVCGEPCSYALVPLGMMEPFSGGRPVSSAPAAAARSFPARCKRFLKNKIMAVLYRFRRKRFADFEKRRQHFADCASRADLPSLNDAYDAFVCGSDVIWNFLYTYGDSAYFLDFAHKYKFSYAASFGKAVLDYTEDGIVLPEPPEKIYRRGISALNAVSVREPYGVELASGFTDREVRLVADPTLLLDAADWAALAGPPVKRGKYIFAYCTSTRDNYVRFLAQLKKETGLPVINVAWLLKDAVRQRTLHFPSPEGWLSLLKNAEYVVTNSFHATAFSVIFHKRFFTAVQDGREVRSNVRLYDFLENVGLSDRLYPSCPDEIPKDAPDFSAADAYLGALRAESIDYLQRNLEAAYEEKRQSEIKENGNQNG